jgi:flagellar basal-body rod protein FlgG
MQAGSSTPSEIGQVELAEFINPGGLISIGRNLFRSSESSGDPITGNPSLDGMGTISQGFIELSNVSVVDEMVNMIVSQRAYEVNSKAVQASDEMLQVANNLKR